MAVYDKTTGRETKESPEYKVPEGQKRLEGNESTLSLLKYRRQQL